MPNIDVTSRLVYTNNPWGSAARGRRAAPDPLRAGVRDRPAGREDGHRPARVPPAQLAAAGRDQGHRPRRAGVAVPGPVRRHQGRATRPRRAAAARGTRTTARVRRGVGLGAAAFGIAMPGDKSIACGGARPGRRRDGLRRGRRPGRGQRLDAQPARGVGPGSAAGEGPAPHPEHRRHGRVGPGVGQPGHLHDRRRRGRRGAAAARGDGRGGRPHPRGVHGGRQPDPLRRAGGPRSRRRRSTRRPARARRSRSRSSRSRWPRWRSTRRPARSRSSA